jgi:uncharacterized membrane protein YtjA (UPF0391 family)
VQGEAAPFVVWGGRHDSESGEADQKQATDTRGGWRVHVISTEVSMLRWSLAFLILALVAAFFGFGGVASTSAGIAVTLFYVFLAVFVITLIMGLLTGRKTIP